MFKFSQNSPLPYISLSLKEQQRVPYRIQHLKDTIQFEEIHIQQRSACFPVGPHDSKTLFFLNLYSEILQDTFLKNLQTQNIPNKNPSYTSRNHFMRLPASYKFYFKSYNFESISELCCFLAQCVHYQLLSIHLFSTSKEMFKRESGTIEKS